MKTYTNNRINRILEVTMKEMLPEQDMEYFEDCLIIQQALRENGYPAASLKAAFELWTIVSEKWGDTWLPLYDKKLVSNLIEAYV